MQTLTRHEALALFGDNLNDIRKACVLNLVEDKTATLDVDAPWNVHDIHTYVVHIKAQAYNKPLLSTIRQIDNRLRPVRKNTITATDIANVKTIPLTELYESTLRRNVGSCPFHDEKTPSFHIYEKTNRFKCFGCGVYGTSIDYIMLRDGVDFITAVRKLKQ